VWLGALASPAGREALVAAFRARCGTLGAEVRVELAERTFVGRAVDLDDAGHLVVERPDDGSAGAGRPVRETVVAGDVVHLRPAE
jgi:BirA family biotin operon repressor/biotin-[acetyl-CoA-carboxylase] ligase